MSYSGLYNREAEEAVIGALVSDSRTHKFVGRLNVKDFAVEEYGSLFDKIMGLVQEKKPVDLVMLKEGGASEHEITVALNAMRAVPTTVNTEKYIEIVKDYSFRRQASEMAISFYKQVGDPEQDYRDSILEMRKKLMDLGTAKAQLWDEMSVIMTKTLTGLEKRQKGEDKGIASGVIGLDSIIGGFFPGELTIIGARPGAGKSALGMVIGLSASKAGKKVAICSLEMVAEQYGQRLLSYQSGVDGMKMRLANIGIDEWGQIHEAAAELARLKSAFTFSVRYVEELEEEIQRMMDDTGVDMLIVDYIQLLGSRKKQESERLKVGYISWTLKQLSMRFGIPVIALAQLKRPEFGTERMPTMKDLRESGNLEADADGIILIHQPINKAESAVRTMHKDMFEDWLSKGFRYTVIKVEKQRMGQLGKVSVLFDGSRMKYYGIGDTADDLGER